MKFKIEKCSDHYRADCLDLPGSPPVGLGSSPEMAMACLMWRMVFNPDTKWTTRINKDDDIVVNDEVWEWPQSYKNNWR